MLVAAIVAPFTLVAAAVAAALAGLPQDVRFEDALCFQAGTVVLAFVAVVVVGFNLVTALRDERR